VITRSSHHDHGVERAWRPARSTKLPSLKLRIN
jgi:hypothetical protein